MHVSKHTYKHTHVQNTGTLNLWLKLHKSVPVGAAIFNSLETCSATIFITLISALTYGKVFSSRIRGVYAGVSKSVNSELGAGGVITQEAGDPPQTTSWARRTNVSKATGFRAASGSPAVNQNPQ